jgi:hypothetical protein
MTLGSREGGRGGWERDSVQEDKGEAEGEAKMRMHCISPSL